MYSATTHAKLIKQVLLLASLPVACVCTVVASTVFVNYPLTISGMHYVRTPTGRRIPVLIKDEPRLPSKKTKPIPDKRAEKSHRRSSSSEERMMVSSTHPSKIVQ